MFTSRPSKYHENVGESVSLRFEPALLTNPETGGHEPAVILFNASRIKFVIPEDDAYRLANQIVDSLESHRARR